LKKPDEQKKYTEKILKTALTSLKKSKEKQNDSLKLSHLAL
jgi:hypothetical protein